jgi:predicted phage tail protein
VSETPPAVDVAAQKETKVFAEDQNAFEFRRKSEVFAIQKNLRVIVLALIGLWTTLSVVGLVFIYCQIYKDPATLLAFMPPTVILLTLAPAGLATLLLGGIVKQVFSWGQSKDDGKSAGDAELSTPSTSLVKAVSEVVKAP